MTREELMNEREKLVEAVARIDKEIAEFDNKINKGKKEKICRLLRELYDSGDTNDFEIKNHYGDYLDLDLDDLVEALEREWF